MQRERRTCFPESVTNLCGVWQLHSWGITPFFQWCRKHSEVQSTISYVPFRKDFGARIEKWENQGPELDLSYRKSIVTGGEGVCSNRYLDVRCSFNDCLVININLEHNSFYEPTLASTYYPFGGRAGAKSGTGLARVVLLNSDGMRAT